MANEHKQALRKFIGRGGSSQMSYSIYVEDGRILYTTENEGHASMRHGDATSTKWISFDDLKNDRVRGGADYYDAIRIDVERQLQLMKEYESETERSIAEAKTAEELPLINSSSPNHIDFFAHNLASFNELPLRDQGIFLLAQIALSISWGKTFSKDDLFLRKGNRLDPKGLAQGFPWYEREIALTKLSGSPWDAIVDAGYVAEARPGSGRYQITHEGWVLFNAIVLGRDCRGDDELPF